MPGQFSQFILLPLAFLIASTGRPASFSPHNYAKTTNDVSAQTLTQYPDCHILIFNVLPVLRSGVFSV